MVIFLRDIYRLTSEQLEDRKQQLHKLVTEELPRNAKDIADARAQGDLSENAEYAIAKEEHAKLLEKKSRLENIINNSTIIKENEKNDEVHIGHTVTFQDTETKEVESIKILGERNGNDTVSAESPLGKALIGGKVGDVKTVEAPEKDFFYLIQKIE